MEINADIQRPRIHVIGNGTSNKFFDVKNEYRVACNVPTHGISYNCLSIIDTRPLDWMLENNWNPPVPVLCTDKVKEYSVKRKRTGHWFDVYEAMNRSNSAHHAVKHHASMTDELHLWGCDSIWTGDYTSQMDQLVPRSKRPDLNQQWIPHWTNIFNDNSNVTFVIHTPEEAVLPVFPNNVRQQKHKN